jgi:hypothetical protein
VPRADQPHDPRIPHCDPVDPYQHTCPLGPGWTAWDIGSSWRADLPPDADAIAERTKRAVGVRDLGALKVRWVWAFDDPSRLLQEAGNPAGRIVSSSHLHTEVTIDDHRVHIDRVTATRTGPGRSIDETRIIVDGVFAGRGGGTGCSLGGGCSHGPAVALVGARKAVLVDGTCLPLVEYEAGETRYMRNDAYVQRPAVRLCRVRLLEGETKVQRRRVLLKYERKAVYRMAMIWQRVGDEHSDEHGEEVPSPVFLNIDLLRYVSARPRRKQQPARERNRGWRRL